MTKYLSDKLKLTVNTTKSQVVKLRDASFLGFEIVRRRIWWTEKSQKKFKERIREITKWTRGHSPPKATSELRIYIRGAMNYYAKGMKYGEARALDQWMRSRMRLYYWTATVRSTGKIAKPNRSAAKRKTSGGDRGRDGESYCV